MARQKKTRKIGSIGVSKDSSAPRTKAPDARKKRHTGKPPGSRNSELLKNSNNSATKQVKDARLGSKKPIPLVREEPKDKRFKSPQDELAFIENDTELQRLLDKEEAEEPLSKAEQNLLNEKLSRHQFLCDLLGISDDSDEEYDKN